MSSAKTVPPALDSDHHLAEMLRSELWTPVNRNNQWRMFCIVGREGTGKSGTMLSTLEAVDPTFSAERVFFRPGNFMEFIEGMGKNERAGKAIAIDEAGVGMGTRSWYDQDQIQLNKMLQTARDDNMIVALTLPRLSELDSQTRGRLHYVLETNQVVPGEFARFRFYYWEPSRDERDKTYRKAPRGEIGGRRVKYRTLAMGPPSEELLENYEARKEEFKAELYAETSAALNEEAEAEEKMGPKEIAADIKDQGVPETFIGVHAGNKMRYIDKDMIQMEYDVSRRDAKKVKKLLQRDDEVTIDDE